MMSKVYENICSGGVRMNDKLRQPGEVDPLFKPGKLISLLDILGGGIATCDQCRRWQRFGALTMEHAREILSADGWTFKGGRELCTICSTPHQKPND
jgi:hypothetical protein